MLAACMPLSTGCIYISSSLALQNTFLGFSNYHLLLSPSILLPHSPLKSDQMSGEESIMLGKPNSPSGSPAAVRPFWALSAFGYGCHPDMTSEYKQICHINRSRRSPPSTAPPSLPFSVTTVFRGGC